jgi:hypothetical protein
MPRKSTVTSEPDIFRGDFEYPTAHNNSAPASTSIASPIGPETITESQISQVFCDMNISRSGTKKTTFRVPVKPAKRIFFTIRTLYTGTQIEFSKHQQYQKLHRVCYIQTLERTTITFKAAPFAQSN